jgi:hypothetical protein
MEFVFFVCIAQHVSAYLAIIRCIKFVEKFLRFYAMYTTFLYTETYCAVDVLNKDIQLKQLRSLKTKFLILKLLV